MRLALGHAQSGASSVGGLTAAFGDGGRGPPDGYCGVDGVELFIGDSDAVAAVLVLQVPIDDQPGAFGDCGGDVLSEVPPEHARQVDRFGVAELAAGGVEDAWMARERERGHRVTVGGVPQFGVRGDVATPSDRVVDVSHVAGR